MVGDKCDGLNAILAEYMDTQLQGEDVCFDVKTTLTPQVSLLFLAMVIFFVANNLSLWLFERCLAERLEDESRAEHTIDWKLLETDADSPMHASSALKHTSVGVTDLKEPLLAGGGEQHSRTTVRREAQSVDKTESTTPSAYQRCCNLLKSCLDVTASRILAALWSWNAVKITSSERMIDVSG